MSKRLFLITLITLLAFGIAFALGTYFIEVRFGTDDASPVTDPFTSEGGQSIDVIQADGSLAIANSAITVTKQTTPVDGELGIRYATTKPAYIGAASLTKMVLKEINNGIAGSDNVSSVFGFTVTNSATATGFAAASAVIGSISANGTRFLIFPQDQAINAWVCATQPVLNDTFFLASIIGGSDEGASGIATATPWYTGGGLNLANYNEGMFHFIKKGSTGKWILNGINPHYSNGVNNPVISSYNSTFDVYDWLVLGNSDSAYYPYMQPLHYQSCSPTTGQIYDDTPEVGVPWDSVSGNFTFNAASFVESDGTGNGITTVELSDDDVYGEIVSNIDNASTGRVAGIVLRRNPATGEYIVVTLNTTTDNLTIQTFNGTSFTQRAAAAVVLDTGTSFKVLIGAAVIDSTVIGYALEEPIGIIPTVIYTSAANTFYGANNTDHGIRVGADGTTGIKFIRFYAMGNDNEYSGLSSLFSHAAAAAGAASPRRMLPFGHFLSKRPYGH